LFHSNEKRQYVATEKNKDFARPTGNQEGKAISRGKGNYEHHKQPIPEHANIAARMLCPFGLKVN
jgi:hypothetical protein